MTDNPNPNPTPMPVETPMAAGQPSAEAQEGVGTDPWAPPAGAEKPVDPARRRRVRRAVARWTAAVLVFASLGGATAYAVTLPDRTDIPGLRTPDDGRWTYPRLSLPRLPEGAPRVSDSDHNPAGRHYADLRALLLPAPRGAKPDPAFPGRGGWLPTSRLVNLYQPADRGDLRARLLQQGLRHIAATAWTAPDGTRVEIYLAQFLSRPYASEVATGALDAARLTQAPNSSVDMSYRTGGVPVGVAPYAYDEDKPRGTTYVRYAALLSGDTVGLVVMSAPSASGGPPAVPFHQTVTLQAQLLG
jgi:hypothetical protein